MHRSQRLFALIWLLLGMAWLPATAQDTSVKMEGEQIDGPPCAGLRSGSSALPLVPASPPR